MSSQPNIEMRGMRAGRLPLRFSVVTLLHIAARGAPIPPTERALGTDLSHWNGNVNFNTMFAAGARFSYFKATQGAAWFDDKYNLNRANVDGLMPWGSYHYLTADAAGSVQANHFCNMMGANPGALPPVLDVELPSVESARIKSFALQFYMLMGNIYPMIYTSSYFWSLVTGTDKAWISAHCPLFVAHWGTDSPILPAGWTNYVIHQYSADGNGLGRMYGAPPEADKDMDLDRCRLSWLQQYAPPQDWAQSITTWARTQGYTGPEPEN